MKPLLTDSKYAIPAPLITIKEIEEITKTKMRGVIHVGANYGEEANEYIRGEVDEVVWIEPQSFGFDQLGQLEREYGHKIFKCAIGDTDGDLDMYITNNVVSSSLRNLGTHVSMAPDCYIKEKETVKVYKLDTFIQEKNIDKTKYNLLNIDTQGTEDQVLSGCTDLDMFDALYIEVNQKNVYVGCKTKEEIAKYLEDRGFVLKLEKKLNPLQWEHLYVRKDLA